MLKEFKEFAIKGNIVDLAVGVIIGGAFQKIVTSLVNDIIMPSISIITGKVDYNDLVFQVGDVSIKYGSFITTIIDFLIIAFSIFIMVKYINRVNSRLEEINEQNKEKLKKSRWFKKKESEKTVVEEIKEEPTTKTCPFCLSEINIKATRCPHCTSVLQEMNETTNK